MVYVKQVPKITKQMHYDNDPGLYEKLVKKITSWADSVPSGTLATPAEVMNFGGYPSGMPAEVWLDPFIKGLPGVSLHKVYGPLTEHSFGVVYLIQKH